MTIILADEYPNFSICGIPFYISREVEHWKNLAHRTAKDIEALGIKIRMRERVMEIDDKKKSVTTLSPTGDAHHYQYDKLILGTGAKSITPPIQGLQYEGVFTLRWIDEMKSIDQYIQHNHVKTAIVVGGGYIGLEMADALTLRGINVHLVEYAPTILTTVDAALGLVVQQKLESQGIQITTRTLIQKIENRRKGSKFLGRMILRPRLTLC